MKRWYLLYVLLLMSAPVFVPKDALQTDPDAYHRQKPAWLQDELTQATGAAHSHPRFHALGTTRNGHDVLAFVLEGGRVSVISGLLATLLAAVIGIALGTLASYGGKTWDAVWQTASTGLIAFPRLLMLIMITTIISPSLVTLIFLLAAFSWIPFAVLTRSILLRLRGENFILHARSTGASSFSLFFRQLLPNLLPELKPIFLPCAAACILAESTLSYLGLGLPVGTPSWGSLIAEGRHDISAWWIWLPPGLLLFVLIYPLNIAIYPANAATKINRV